MKLKYNVYVYTASGKLIVSFQTTDELDVHGANALMGLLETEFVGCSIDMFEVTP